MEKIVLSHILLHSLDEVATQNLYVRGDVYIKDGQALLWEGKTIHFNTYYNAFFYSKYMSYTQLQSVNAVMEVFGSCRVELILMTPEGHTTILETKENHNDSKLLVFSQITLSDLSAGGMLFLKVTGLSGQAAIYRGYWEGEILDVREISLAIIICTYKREEYVRRNTQLLQRTILESDENIQLFVIDNGKTLKCEEKNDKIHILPNYN